MTDTAQDFRLVSKISCMWSIIDSRGICKLAQFDKTRAFQHLAAEQVKSGRYAGHDRHGGKVFVFSSSGVVRGGTFCHSDVRQTRDALWVKDRAHQKAERTMRKRAGGSDSACPPMETGRVTTKCTAQDVRVESPSRKVWTSR